MKGRGGSSRITRDMSPDMYEPYIQQAGHGQRPLAALALSATPLPHNPYAYVLYVTMVSIHSSVQLGSFNRSNH